MTNLEHHVTSLELSRKLKELGVPQPLDALNWWVADAKTGESYLNRSLFSTGSQTYVAFLASELGEMLPVGYIVARRDDGYVLLDGDVWEEPVPTEPNARAKLLIHLIEQGVVDPKNL